MMLVTLIISLLLCTCVSAFNVVDLPKTLTFSDALGLYDGREITGGSIYDIEEGKTVAVTQQQAMDFYYGCKDIELERRINKHPFSGKAVTLTTADGQSYVFYFDSGVQIGTYGSSYMCYEAKEGSDILYSLHDIYEDGEKQASQARPAVNEANYLTLPQAPWAQPYAVKAADYGLLPYEFTKKYSNNISREEFCILLGQLICVENNYLSLQDYMSDNGLVYLRNYFSDCQNVDDSVFILHALGIVNGVTDSEFNPHGAITREQAAKLLYETASKFTNVNLNASPQYSDNQFISPWARPYVAWVTNTGIMSGISENVFGPLENYTVEQAAATAVRLYEMIGKF